MVHLGNDWDEILAGEFEQDYYKRIRYWLKKEYAEQTIYPAAENIFNALRYTPYSKVKAVILGQDPYQLVNGHDAQLAFLLHSIYPL